MWLWVAVGLVAPEFSNKRGANSYLKVFESLSKTPYSVNNVYESIYRYDYC
jgi:hypothetical protein